MEMVAMSAHAHNDGRRSAQWCRQSDEDSIGSCENETLDKFARSPEVDVARYVRSALAPIQARVVHVDIETVLVRRVPETAILSTERSAVRNREIADDDPGPVGMILTERVEDTEGAPNRFGGAPMPVVGRGRDLRAGIPRDVVRTVRGE